MAKTKKYTRRQRSTRRRRILTRKRKGGDWPRLKNPLKGLFPGSPRSPVSSVGSVGSISLYNETPPESPRSNGSSSPNPFYAGEECMDHTLTTQPIGMNMNSEQNLFNKLYARYFAELGSLNTETNIQRKSANFLLRLRKDPQLLTSIVGVVRDSTRKKLIEKFCATIKKLK